MSKWSSNEVFCGDLPIRTYFVSEWKGEGIPGTTVANDLVRRMFLSRILRVKRIISIL